MQKTDFPFEILVGEDESTDGTREICLDYARRFPDRVKVFLRSRRDVVHIDGRARGSFNFRMTLREAQGEFIALCEGDDYWTDPEKLQRQVEYLRTNSDCVGCFHDVKVVDAQGAVLQESYFASNQAKFSQKDVLTNLLSRQATCAMVFRKTAFDEPLPAWYLRRPCDLYLDILLTMQGALGLVPHNMGAYRRHGGGIWSGQRGANQIVELVIRLKLLLADPYFLQHYREDLLRKIDELQLSLFTRDDHAAEIRRLEEIVQEQTDAFKAIDAERHRLAVESDHTSANAQRLANDAQKHIDELLAQLGRRAMDSQKQIDQLMEQLNTLTETSRQQSEYIEKLRQERDQLIGQQSILQNESQGYTNVIKEQTVYIKTLQSERDQLAAREGALTANCAHYLKVIEEQTAYIALLEKTRRTAFDGLRS